MSPKTHRSEYAILAVLGLVTGLVLLVMVGRGWLRQEHSAKGGVRTTRSTNVDATLIYYTLCERLGLVVEQSNDMFNAEQHRQTGVVISLDPLVSFGAGEVGELSDWLFQGGVFVTTAVPRGLGSSLDRLEEDLPRRRPFVSTARERPLGQGGPGDVPVGAQSLPLARDVSSVDFAGARVLDSKWLESDSPAVLEGLFEDSRGWRIAEYAIGRGRLILLSDSSFLANGLIAREDNAVLAVNLISYAFAQAPREKIVFDEYHFGYGSRNRGFGVLGGMLLTTSAGWAVLSLTAAGVLFLIYKGRQFGPRRGLAKERRRSKTEYVYAVGATLRTAGAHRLTFELINTWFRRRAASAVGLIPSASNEAIAAGLARLGSLESPECLEILDECDRLAARSKLSERQFHLAVAQLVRIEKEILHGSGNGQRVSR